MKLEILLSLGVFLCPFISLAGFDPSHPDAISAERACVSLVPGDGGVRVRIESTEPLSFVRLSWKCQFDETVRFFGGNWERTYGTTGWTRAGVKTPRPMPWYFIAEEKKELTGFGVKVQPGAFAAWVVTNDCVELVLDCRAGSDP